MVTKIENIVEKTATIATEIVANAAVTDKQAAFPRQSIELLGKHGLMGLSIPKQFGGLEVNARTFAEVVEIIGASCGSTGMIFVMHCCGIECIVNHMKDPARENILRLAAQGKHLSTLACSERGTGAHFVNSNSTSEAKGSGFALNAEKCFVTSATHADSYVVPTRAVGSEDAVNTSVYLVEKDLPGMTFHGRWEGMGLRGNNSIAMTLKNCEVSSTALLGEQGEGLKIEMGTILPRFILGTAAVYQGIARAAWEACAEHVKQRSYTHTGEGLSAVPQVRRSIAEMKVAVDSSRALLMEAARAWDAKEENALVLLLEAKQRSAQIAIDVSKQAMQVCGGIAYSGALPVERHMRDAFAGNVMAPTTDVLLDIIGRAYLGLPLM